MRPADPRSTTSSPAGRWLLGGALLLLLGLALGLSLGRALPNPPLILPPSATPTAPVPPPVVAGDLLSPSPTAEAVDLLPTVPPIPNFPIVVPGPPAPPPTSSPPPLAAPDADLFHGCPPSGDGGDAALNVRKNRTLPGAWEPTDLAALLGQPWPETVARRARPLAGPRRHRCRGHRSARRGSHWLADRRPPGKPRIPQLPLAHRPGLSPLARRRPDPGPRPQPDRRSDAARGGPAPGVDRRGPTGPAAPPTQVRVRGWLLLDQEHPEQLGDTRATLWEIQPVLDRAVWTGTDWAALPAARTPPAVLTAASAGAGAYPTAATISHLAPTRNTRVTVTGTLCPPGQPVAGAQEEHLAACKSTAYLPRRPPERQRPVAGG